MILLEPGSRVLGDAVDSQLSFKFDEAIEMRDQQRNAFDVTLWDFDDVSYRVSVDPEKSPTDLWVSMNLPCYAEIKDSGAEAALNEAFPGMIQDTPVTKFNVTLKIDMAQFQEEKAQAELARKLKLIKSIAVGGVFKNFLQPLADKKAPSKEGFKFALRADTQVYFAPGEDRVTIIYGIDFSERVDKVIAKVFMQEFQDGMYLLS
jgi:hypothetical protein